VRGWWIKLLKYALPYWKTLALIGALMLCNVGLETLGPWPVKILVDYVFSEEPLPDGLSWIKVLPGTHGTIGLIGWLAAATVLIYLANQAAHTAKTYLETGVGTRMSMDLGGDLFDRLQRLSLRFHGRQMTGDLLRRVTHDTGCVRQLVIDVAIPSIQAICTLLALFTVMWNMDRSLSILAMMVAPPLGLLIKVFARPMAERTYEQQNMEGQMMAMAERTLTALPVVQAFGGEMRELSKFRLMSMKTLEAYLRAVASQLEFKVAVGGVIAVGTALIMGIGGIHAVKETLTVGGLLVFLTYLGSLYGPMTTLAYLASGLASAKGGARRVLEVMAENEEIREMPGARPMPPSSPKGREVKFEKVTVGYELQRPVLRDISFAVMPGETIAIVGPTGSGKSTLVSLIPRLLDPWEGKVLIDGKDVREISLDSLRSQVAIVLQDPFLMPLTIAENISYGKPGANLSEIIEAAKKAGAHEFIQRLPKGYETVLGEKGANLSGGERQRIAIARALLKDAPILILDEPTSSLDSVAETNLLEALERLMEGRTTFIIAHRLSTVGKADRILVLSEGRMVEMGTHQELLERGGIYAKLYEIQMDATKKAESVL
jgi:ATP-binding cassette subfamily B protein/subfamily B ATP-binding cassette protein MsbA